MTKKTSLLFKVALAALSLTPSLSSGFVIFSEDFAGTSGGVGSLDNTLEDQSGAQWSANGFATDNGVLNTGQFEGSAVLAFTPMVGNIYSLSLDVTSSSNRWVGLGFSTNGPVENGAGDAQLNRPGDRFAQSGGQSWFLYRPDANSVAEEVQIFGGPNTANGIADTDVDFDATITAPRTLTVILDTTADLSGASYQADYFIDGVSLLSAGPATISQPLSSIGVVGFTFEGPAGGATPPITVDNFLFESIPEPSTTILAALGVLGLMRRRR